MLKQNENHPSKNINGTVHILLVYSTTFFLQIINKPSEIPEGLFIGAEDSNQTLPTYKDYINIVVKIDRVDLTA